MFIKTSDDLYINLDNIVGIEVCQTQPSGYCVSAITYDGMSPLLKFEDEDSAKIWLNNLMSLVGYCEIDDIKY